MENKNWKYVKRHNSIFSLIDLKLAYKRDTGYDADWDTYAYLHWLEELAIAKVQLHTKLIPWEPIKK
jgi:hypothetical protein